MAYPQENLYIKNGNVGQKRPYDPAYTNGGNTNSPRNIPVNLIRDPNSYVQTPQQAVQPPRPAQSVQVVIPHVSAAVNGGRPQPPPVDYQLLLLSLAEDYFAAAHGEGSMVALTRRQSDIQAYHKLIATGLGCLEVVLKVWHQSD